MAKELMIDHAVYLVDDITGTYSFFRRNPDWKTLPPYVNDHNKRRIDGYVRVFRDGHTTTFHVRKAG